MRSLAFLCGLRAELVRCAQVAGEVLERLTESAAAWLDRGTEHPHRVALSVRGDRLGAAVEQLRAGFEAAGVQAGACHALQCLGFEGL